MTPAQNRPLTVDEARARVLEGVTPSAATDALDLLAAHGRVLAAPVLAQCTQPPFAASAMDGYAVRRADIGSQPVVLTVIGEAAAGHGFTSPVRSGEAVRIFTGAPLPDGCDTIVIQEDTRRVGAAVTIADSVPDAGHIRPLGGDFRQGQTVLAAGIRLGARHLTLAAAAGFNRVTVRRPPTVAILATGDELVWPGTLPLPGQIVCSNPFGVAAMVAAAGGAPRLIGIARDTRESLQALIAEAAACDILVTLGGASVGDHDLVGPVLAGLGMDLAFWTIAMRPGKPMLFGHLGAQRVLGLPGNPVSSLITARLFLVPLIHALLGLPATVNAARLCRLGEPLAANGPRAHYMRAVAEPGHDGTPEVRPLPNQDSSLLTPLAAANCLIVRPINAPAVPAGHHVPTIPMDF